MQLETIGGSEPAGGTQILTLRAADAHKECCPAQTRRLIGGLSTSTANA